MIFPLFFRTQRALPLHAQRQQGIYVDNPSHYPDPAEMPKEKNFTFAPQ